MKKTLLLILDGLGIAPKGEGNPIYQAQAPTIQKLLDLPQMLPIEASGRAVGLPAGFIGNSEVGHLNIGAGTIVYQDMTKIDIAIEDGSFFKNPTIVNLLAQAKEKGGNIHFMGLLSDGGVHSHIDHIKALLKCAKDADVPAFLHAFIDGRDVAPTSGVHFVEKILPALEENNAHLASLCGRFYAMDRDNRWERVQEAYDLLVCGKGIQITDPIKALQDAYAQEEYDEFIKPRLLNPNGIIKDNDAVFFFNFRADRARELSHALSDKEFEGFAREKVVHLSSMASMTMYDSSLKIGIAFPKQNLKNTLGERISAQNIPQLRIAETEKYAHVTYFFNGGREEPFPLEDRILIPSPRDVATYDLKPEMSAKEVTSKLLDAMQSEKYQFVVCNLANPDMIGHTGNIKASIKALEVVDSCVEDILALVAENDWRIVIMADHGNIEEMLSKNNQPQTAHTLNPVPLIHIDGSIPQDLDPKKFTKLADVAKLILD